MTYRLRHRLALLLPLLVAVGLWSAPAPAQVQRCVNAMGEMVYTDRACKDIGAAERMTQAPAQSQRQQYVGCSRRLRDLVTTMQYAIHGRDPNLLASVYDWTGMSTQNGYALMSRLEQIVQRPLDDILPVYGRAPTPVLNTDGSVADTNRDGYYPQAERRAPIGVQLLQTFPNGRTPSRTVFGLRKKMGCWWVRM